VYTSFNKSLAGCTDPANAGVNWQRCNFSEKNLLNVNLKEARLRDTRFIRSILNNSNLSFAKADRAKFINTKAVAVIFYGAQLRGADFTKADLEKTTFENSDLRQARFFRANLKNSNFTGAKISGADFLKANLSGVRWVDGKTICAEGSIGQCQ
tara:strand:+ start:192 stop:653 length:462 start_codon:yes stop_codon:yes gene_type:complete